MHTKDWKHDFFAEHGLKEKIEHRFAEYDEAALEENAVLKPDFEDLRSLYNLCTLTGRTTVLEFGCGWSSYVFALYCAAAAETFGDLSSYKRSDAFQIHSLDNYETYSNIARKRVPEELQSFVHFHLSPVDMCEWNGRIATSYQSLPVISPDFIYLDGPDQPGTKGEVSGLSMQMPNSMPMACDILKFEHFLVPKTIIVVDGRAANARFLKCNLQREWSYKYCTVRDQHFFVLEEEPLGKASEKLIAEVYYKHLNWTIEDL